MEGRKFKWNPPKWIYNYPRRDQVDLQGAREECCDLLNEVFSLLGCEPTDSNPDAASTISHIELARGELVSNDEELSQICDELDEEIRKPIAKTANTRPKAEVFFTRQNQIKLIKNDDAMSVGDDAHNEKDLDVQDNSAIAALQHKCNNVLLSLPDLYIHYLDSKAVKIPQRKGSGIAALDFSDDEDFVTMPLGHLSWQMEYHAANFIEDYTEIPWREESSPQPALQDALQGMFRLFEAFVLKYGRPKKLETYFLSLYTRITMREIHDYCCWVATPDVIIPRESFPSLSIRWRKNRRYNKLRHRWAKPLGRA